MELKTVMRPTDSANGLRSLCNYLKNTFGEIVAMVEVGSYIGESAEIFAQEFPNTIIYCIDPWVGGFDDSDSCSVVDYSEIEAQFDARASKYTNIQKLKGNSTDYKIPCDFVYIDGCHKYECVKEDIIHWSPFASKAICGHDYYNDYIDTIQPHTAGVRKAVNELLGNPTMIFDDNSYVKIKKNL